MTTSFETVAGLRSKLAAGDVSSVELTRDALTRISDLNPELNAVISSSEERAINAAKKADEARRTERKTRYSGSLCCTRTFSAPRVSLPLVLRKCLLTSLPPMTQPLSDTSIRPAWSRLVNATWTSLLWAPRTRPAILALVKTRGIHPAYPAARPAGRHQRLRQVLYPLRRAQTQVARSDSPRHFAA